MKRMISVIKLDVLPISGHYLHDTIGARAGRWQLLTVVSEHRKILQRTLQDILNIQSGCLSKMVIKLKAEDWRRKEILREEAITQ